MADVLFILYLIFFIVFCIFAYNERAWNWLFPFYWKAKTEVEQWLSVPKHT